MEAAEQAELRALARGVGEQVVAYLGSQLEGSVEEMELLRSVALALDGKYAKMQRDAQRLGRLSKVLKARATAMEDKTRTIDAIDEELADLEDMVAQLDAYTASLQIKFNQVL